MVTITGWSSISTSFLFHFDASFFLPKACCLEMIRSWVWLALEKHDHPWALVPRAGSFFRVGGHLEMTMITQWLGGYGWLKIKLLEVRKKKQPLWHVPFNFMRFFPISLLNLFHQGFIGPKNTKKSSTKRSIYSSLSLVLSPYQPLRSWYLPPEEKCGSVGRHRWVNSLEGIFFEMKNLMLEEKWTQHFADCTST